MSMRLFDAIRTFRYQQILMLLKRGVEIDVRNKKGQTGLMIICTIKNIESSKRLHMFRFLLKQKAEPLEADSNGKSVFHYACEGGHDSIINVILRIYNPNAVNHIGKDKDGRTAMHFAVMSGKVSTTKLIFRLFQDRFLSVDVPDNRGITPLIEARKLGLDDVSDFLQKTARANPHICDTTFHRSAEEWAREASKRRRERLGAEIRKRREQKLIYPRGRIKMRRLPTMLELSQAATFPRVSDFNKQMSIRVKDPDVLRKSDWNYDDNNDVKGQQDVKSRRAIDSTLSLLELSSKVNERGYHVTSFVTSRSVPQKFKKESPQHLPAMFNVYANQLSPSFYKEARVPEKPQNLEKRSKRADGNSKLSTLAVMLHRGKHPQKKLTRQLTNYKHSEDNKILRKPERRASEGSLTLSKQPILPGIRVVKAIEEEVET